MSQLSPHSPFKNASFRHQPILSAVRRHRGDLYHDPDTIDAFATHLITLGTRLRLQGSVASMHPADYFALECCRDILGDSMHHIRTFHNEELRADMVTISFPIDEQP